MHRIAVFVEGYTEVLFVKKLLEEMAGSSRVEFQLQKILGGGATPRRVVQLQGARPGTAATFLVLIVDCGGDRLVKPRLVEEHAALTKNGYSRLVAIRDVRPDFAAAEIPKLEKGLKYGVKTALAPVDFILSVMEIEAWFISEATHFPRIHASITRAAIVSNLGFDPVTDDITARATPSRDLNDCYQLAGRTYDKGTSQTVDALDFAEIYLTLPGRIPYVRKLTEVFETFLNLGP